MQNIFPKKIDNWFTRYVPVSENEEHWINDVTLPAPVGSNDRCETLVEGTKYLVASIRFKEIILYVSDYQSK